jgi:hypothetical protein
LLAFGSRNHTAGDFKPDGLRKVRRMRQSKEHFGIIVVFLVKRFSIGMADPDVTAETISNFAGGGPWSRALQDNFFEVDQMP